jgi:hypothetical protein
MKLTRYAVNFSDLLGCRTQKGRGAMGETKEEGWGFPALSKKAHYFVGSRSLCNRWLFFGNLEGDDETSSDDCTTCTRQLAKRKAAKEKAA